MSTAGAARSGAISVAADGSQGEAVSNKPVISADSPAVVFDSNATTLVAGDTNGVNDVFVRGLAWDGMAVTAFTLIASPA